MGRDIDELVEILPEEVLSCPSCRTIMKIINRDYENKSVEYKCDSCPHTETRNKKIIYDLNLKNN